MIYLQISSTYHIPQIHQILFENSHFLRFTSNWCFFNVSRTYIKCEMCSSQVTLYTSISSKLTITNESIKGCSTSLINLINVDNALYRPNGMTNHSYKYFLVLKVVFLVSCSLTQTRWYLDFKASLVKYFSCYNWYIRLSILCKGYLLLSVILCNTL